VGVLLKHGVIRISTRFLSSRDLANAVVFTTHGYEETREASMAAFAKSWRTGDSCYPRYFDNAFSCVHLQGEIVSCG
jgi:hypothetical protein